MGLKNVLDGTYDSALVIDASETLGAGATASSSIFDLGSDQPARLRIRFNVTTCDVATSTSAVILNVMGSTDSGFASGVCTLGGSTLLGHPTAVASNFFAQNSNARGVGEYVVDCTNQALDAVGGQYGCRYLRIQAKTIGASSSLVYSASIERAPIHS